MFLWAESESYVTTDGQSASQSWNKAPVWGLRPDFYYHRTVAGLLMWGALSDERMGLSFTIAAASSQRSHSLVRDPLDSRPYFTVSDLRLPISSPPTTRTHGYPSSLMGYFTFSNLYNFCDTQFTTRFDRLSVGT
jgi:hypothetical protein